MLAFLRLLGAHPRLLGFGFLLPFVSAYGQTFFLGVFGAEWRRAFDLSNGAFGLVYSLATLASAALLLWLGRLIDRVDLRAYTAATLGACAGSCAFVALMPTHHAGFLLLAFVLLRMLGQGLMSHIGVTTMGRYFEQARGTAVSIASLGFPVAEGVFPPLGVALLATVGWRGTWGLLGAVLLIGVLPLALWLLRGHSAQEQARAGRQRARAAEGSGAGDWRLGQALHDPRFYLMLPGVLVTPFTVTGLFFHQTVLVAQKGWTLAGFAGAFVVFAAVSMVATLLAGRTIDRGGARRLLPVFLLPLAAGLGLLTLGDGAWIAPAFMAGTGITAGVGLTLMGAIWAEVYGPTHLGAIRSFVWSLVLGSTALAPVLFGTLLDDGVSMAALAGACLVLALAAALLAVPVARRA